MDINARLQLLSAFDRLRRRTHRILPGQKLHSQEVFMMYHIQSGCGCENGVEVSRLGFGASRPAVSQMLGSLERRGYIERNIAPDDRRKIIVNLTREGEDVLTEAKSCLDKSLDALIERLGEKDFKELLRLMSRMDEIVSEIDKEDEI